jgi:E3 ubiquitin-protein ligase EDD1
MVVVCQISSCLNVVCSGSSGIIYIDPSSLRRTATLPTVAAATMTTNQDSTVTMSTTSCQLARMFGVVVRQIADLLMMMQDYHALVPNLPRVLDISTPEVLDLQVTINQSINHWLVNSAVTSMSVTSMIQRHRKRLH